MRLSEYDHMPPVALLMTPFPYFVEPDESVEQVSKLMELHAIRHIPVKCEGDVVGVVSGDAVALVLRRGGGFGAMTAGEIQSSSPYIVELTAPLNGLLRGMAEVHADVAVVMKDGKLAGIVTVTDICEALSGFLEDRFADSSGAA